MFPVRFTPLKTAPNNQTPVGRAETDLKTLAPLDQVPNTESGLGSDWKKQLFSVLSPLAGKVSKCGSRPKAEQRPWCRVRCGAFPWQELSCFAQRGREFQLEAGVAVPENKFAFL